MRPTPAGASVRGRLSDARYMMELGDQLIALIVEACIRPAHYRDIEVNDRLLQMWRGMSRDMYSLMWHVVGVTTAFTRLTRIVARYDRTVACDGQSVRHSVPSSHDRSPCSAPDENEPPLASSRSRHGDEAGPSASSSQQHAASNSTHDHEQTGPSTVEAAPLTEQASTSTASDVVLPPADP